MRKQDWLIKGRSTVVLVAVVLVFGSFGQLPSAQASTNRSTRLQYFMMAKLLNSSTICVGETAFIAITVDRADMTGIQGDNVQLVPGVTVKGTVENPSVGTLFGGGNVTGWNPSSPGRADMKFKAKKAGTTKLNFEAQINHIWWASKLFSSSTPIVDRRDFVKDSLSITVEDCNLKVSTSAQWHVEGPANMKFTATVDEAPLTDDGTGHYTGTGTVNWAASSSAVGDCGGNLTASPSHVDLSGDMNEETSLLTVKMTFDASTASLTSNCGNWNLPITPDSIQFVTTLDGGASSQPQVLRGPESMSGHIQIDILPVEKGG